METHSNSNSHHILTGQTERIASVSPAVSVRMMTKISALATFILLVTGAQLMGGTGSGWPELDGFNYRSIHEAMAATVGLLVLLVALLVQFKDPRRFMKKLGWSAVALVVVQALFGRLILETARSPFVSMAFWGISQVFLCITIALAVFSSRTWYKDFAAPVVQRLENRGYLGFMKFAIAIVLLQVILGAGVRHSDDAGNMFLPFVTVHICGAFLVIFAVIWLFLRTWQVYKDVTPLRRTAYWAAGIVCFQIVFGILSIFANRARLNPELVQAHHVVISALHVLGGTSLLALLFASFLRAHHLLDVSSNASVPAQAYQSHEVNA